MAVRVVFILVVVCLAYVHSKQAEKLTCKQIKDFVNGHNSRRLQLAKGEVAGQPAASEMNYMVWDDELAAKAAKWASKNKNFHNPDRRIGSGRFQTGENLYWYSTTDPNYKLNVDNAMDSWFGEHKYFKFHPLQSSDFSGAPGGDIGHYTQMAWAGTTYVGCAYLHALKNGWNNYYVVCNYGPAGNYLGQAPYKPGKPSGKLVCGNKDCSKLYGDKC